MTSVVGFTIMEIETVSREESMKVQDNMEKQNIVSEDAPSLFLKTGLQFLAGVYVFLILCVMPLYFTDGYAYIGRDKYAFFYQVTTTMGVLFGGLLIALWGWKLLRRNRKKNHAGEVMFAMNKASAETESAKAWGESAETESAKALNLTDKFALGYAVAVLLSYFFSPYREGGVYADAWYGTQGWFMGAFSQLLFVGIYFAVSRFWKVSKWQLVMILPVTFGVFVLGICNRFSLYPIPMKGANPEFLSTVGNINWYCSYLVLVLFAGMFYYCAGEEKRKPVKVVMAVWLAAGFGALLTQGSLSGLFTLGVMLLVMYMCSVHSVQRAEAFAKCLICLGGAATVVYILRLLFAACYNYPDTMTDLVTNAPLALFALGFGVYAWYLLRKRLSKNTACEKSLVTIGYAVCGIAGLAVLVYLVLATVNTLRPGSLGALSEVSLFTFDGAWGSNRGICWTVGWNCFWEQDLWGKMVGIGPDTMVEYVRAGLAPDLLAAVQDYFGNFRLTNAHNEWLTILVNEGILGLAMYGGLLVSAIVRMIKAKQSGMVRNVGERTETENADATESGRRTAGKTNLTNLVLAGACGMAVLAYVINSMFGFQQVMGTGTLFVLLGMGEACLRAE